MTPKDMKPDENADEFFVAPSPIDPSQLIGAFDDIKNALKRSEIRSRKRTDESEDTFVARLALSSQNVGRPLFRKRGDSDAARIAAWLGLVRDRANFVALSKKGSHDHRLNVEDVREIAALASDEGKLRDLENILFARYRVILVIEEGFSSMKLDGGTFKLPSGYPVVALTLRYPRYDHFWFTLLHELAHVAMHYESLDEPVLEDLESVNGSLMEVEANRLASDSIIPPAAARRLFRAGSAPTTDDLQRLAVQLNQHPALLAGMYRYRMGKYNAFSDLVNSIDVRTMLRVTE